ncbi:NAD(P)H-binding protein [Candidatus Saccharibacteria bacterium]|nr:NAD(P)H-binding protein [Candidatus Saccharibacteria bacterium]
MKVVVFGASGRVGSRVVELLLASGHEVVATVHSKNPFEKHPSLTVAELDIHDQKAVDAAIRGADAVVSTVSNWGSETGDVLTAAMRAIVPAMKKHHVMRLISLTGNAAFSPDDKPSLVQKANRAMLQRIAPKVLADGEKHMEVLRQTDLDWTVIRSPVMNTLGKEAYKLKKELSGGAATIHRQSVAQAIVDQLHDGTWLRQTPTIWRA